MRRACVHTCFIEAGGLHSTAVHTEVDGAQAAGLAELAGIRVDHLHHVGVHVSQFVGAPNKRTRRVQG